MDRWGRRIDREKDWKTPEKKQDKDPDWSDFGPDSLAPGETEVPSFEETIEQYQEKQESSILTSDSPSQAEQDYYASLDSGEDPEITQDHLNEIGMGEDGEGNTAENMVKTEEEIAEDNAPENQPVEDDPGFTSELNSYIDPETGKKRNQTQEQWSSSIGEDAISVGPTDTTPNELAGGSLMAGSSSEGGGYGKKRKAEQSRGQMNLTSGRNRSILTS